VISNQGLRGPDGESMAWAECPNCSWKGPLSKTIGAVTSEQFWDAKRVGEAMIRVMAVHGAGPLVQALEFIGLLPRKRLQPEKTNDFVPELKEQYERELALFKDPSTPKWNIEAQKSRDAVMQRIMEAAITAGFEEAERQNRRFAMEMGTDIHSMLKEEPEKEIGGTVTSIKKARKKRKKR
jgi:hypothetical protein